jgi:Cobalamin synthesis protein cobW C-terminal domain
VKGILNVAGTDNPVAVHGVQHLVHPPTHMSAWPDHERRSRLVLIVKGLDPAAIERSLCAFGLRPPADLARVEPTTRDFQESRRAEEANTQSPHQPTHRQDSGGETGHGRTICAPG